MKRHLITGVIAAALMGLASSAYATPITPSPTIVSGDKTFNNFGCNVTGNPTPSLTCGGISVTAHTSTQPPDFTAGDFGIRFQAAFSSGPGTEDVAISYTATVTTGSALFHDVSLWFNGTGLPGTVVASAVTEDVFIHGTSTNIGHIVVNNPGIVSKDILLSQDVASIDVIKDISLTGNVDVAAVISLIDQNFSQTAVPEPASLVLLGMGLLGFGLLRRKRS